MDKTNLSPKENLQELVPEDERLESVDFKSATVRSCDSNLQSLIPDDELAVQNIQAENEKDVCISEEFFKATDGMAYIENVLDNRLVANIFVDEKGKRVFEVCQKYADGTISGKMRIPQADLYRLAMANFDVESIPTTLEKQKTKKFLSYFGDEYLGKIEKDDIIPPMDILQAVYAVRGKLPVHRREQEMPAQQLYRRIMEIFKNEMFGTLELTAYKRKAYYVLFSETMESLAKYLKMPLQKLLHQLAEYNFLYIQNSSNGYQSKVRLYADDASTATWAYCLYDLEYLSQEKRKRENKTEELDSVQDIAL